MAEQNQKLTPRTTRWTLDLAHSRAEFEIRHLMIANVRGTIPIRNVEIERDETDVTRSKLVATLGVAGINTGVADRDAHLRSPDFFDVEQYPEMRFQSTRVEETSDGLRIHGDLTIRDVTKPLVLDLEYTGEIADDGEGNRRIGATLSTSFDRKSFGLTWNMALEAGGVLVGDKVKVRLDVEGVQLK